MSIGFTVIGYPVYEYALFQTIFIRLFETWNLDK